MEVVGVVSQSYSSQPDSMCMPSSSKYQCQEMEWKRVKKFHIDYRQKTPLQEILEHLIAAVRIVNLYEPICRSYPNSNQENNSYASVPFNPPKCTAGDKSGASSSWKRQLCQSLCQDSQV